MCLEKIFIRVNELKNRIHENDIQDGKFKKLTVDQLIAELEFLKPRVKIEWRSFIETEIIALTNMCEDTTDSAGIVYPSLCVSGGGKKRKTHRKQIKKEDRPRQKRRSTKVGRSKKYHSRSKK